MKKKRSFLWVIYKTLCFYYKRNTPVGNALITAVIFSIVGAIVEGEPGLLLFPVIVAIIMVPARRIYITVDAIGSPIRKMEARMERQETKRKLKEYLNESM